LKGVIPILHVIDALCLQGNAAAEDRIGGNEQYIFVIDGASGLNGCHVTPHPSDAAWLAEGLRLYLERELPHTARTIPEIMSRAAAALKAEYDGYWAENGLQGAPDYPSAGVAVFRLCGDAVEYFGLGDCDALLETADGQVLCLEETALSALDRSAIGQMADYARAHGCTMLQARTALNHVLVHNRDLRNTPEGYWIFDPTGEGVPHARTARWPADQVKGLAVLSDGFAQLYEPFGAVESLPALYALMHTKGLAACARSLFAMQDADPECMEYPRFKLRDDTSAVLAELM